MAEDKFQRGVHGLHSRESVALVCRVGAQIRSARQLPGSDYQAAQEVGQKIARNTRQSLLASEQHGRLLQKRGNRLEQQQQKRLIFYLNRLINLQINNNSSILRLK